MLTLRRSSIPAALIAALAVTVAVVTVARSTARPAPLQPDALLAYEAELVAHARQVGAVIEAGANGEPGMKRAIGAIERGELHGDPLRAAAASWERTIRDSARGFAAVRAPDGIETARTRALDSFATYQELARALGAIADRAGPDLDAALDQAIALGSRGDAQFDAAAAVIQAARRDLGLAPSASLPDPDRPLPDGVDIYDAEDLYPEDSP